MIWQFSEKIFIKWYTKLKRKKNREIENENEFNRLVLGSNVKCQLF